MKKILILFGTRPEAIKMAPVIRALQQLPNWFQLEIVLTGQHREQVEQVMNHFQIQPDMNLNLMHHNQTLAFFTSRAIERLNILIKDEKPDLILVHGDTQTSLCGSLCAYFNQVPLGHVEAGLRSYNKYSPWPEEMNRKVNDVLADFMFVPTAVNKQNLLSEGYHSSQIFITGQTAVDAAIKAYKTTYRFLNKDIDVLDFNHNKVITVTIHRRENIGHPMQRIFNAIRKIANNDKNVKIIFPVHLNPAVRKSAFSLLSGIENIHLLDPIDYPDMINLIARSTLLISDSGGLQEEATTFHVPMILARNTTERPEAINTHMMYLAGTDTENICSFANKHLQYSDRIDAFQHKKLNPFGDGKASERIAGIIAQHFGFLDTLPAEFTLEGL